MSTLTARQNLEEQLDEVTMEILETEQYLLELQNKEKDIKHRLEAMNDTLAQSAKAVRFVKPEDFDQLAGDY